eukprot:5199619-Alexandrium_andersonii.AAC.1
MSAPKELQAKPRAQGVVPPRQPQGVGILCPVPFQVEACCLHGHDLSCALAPAPVGGQPGRPIVPLTGPLALAQCIQGPLGEAEQGVDRAPPLAPATTHSLFADAGEEVPFAAQDVQPPAAQHRVVQGIGDSVDEDGEWKN